MGGDARRLQSISTDDFPILRFGSLRIAEGAMIMRASKGAPTSWTAAASRTRRCFRAHATDGECNATRPHESAVAAALCRRSPGSGCGFEYVTSTKSVKNLNLQFSIL